MSHAPIPQPLPADFVDALDRTANRRGALGHRVLWFEDIGSTNDVAMVLAESGADHGVVVAADAQRAGRGRLGRHWASPVGAGLYASVILRPARVVPMLTLAVGVGVADGIETATGLAADLKWPNDVLVETRKLAGILTESGSGASGERFIVVGVGVNVHTGQYPREVTSVGTSLEAELGRAIGRGPLFAEILAAVNASYSDVVEGRASDVLGRWRQRARRTLGRRVQWDEHGHVRVGVARDIDEAGALVVDTDEGVRHVVSGEVMWR